MSAWIPSMRASHEFRTASIAADMTFPRDDVTRRFSGRWEAVAKVLPYCDEAEFYDNDNGFVKVAEYRNGEFRTVGMRSPNWILDLQAYLKA